MARPLLEVRDLHFSYGKSSAILRGTTLEVPRGTCLCLMGVNGCGKSTLIDCVLGELAVASGDVLFDGAPLAGLPAPERARLVAFVPQVHDRTFPYEVEHVVRMGRTAYAGIFGMPDSDEDDVAVERALDLCGIRALAKRPYTTLSGGEMQMVMLARALAQDTPLVIMDEPTAHLDFRNELLFLEVVEALVRERGVTVLMATHSPNQAFHLEAAKVPTRVALMCDGVVMTEGTPSEVLNVAALRDVFGVRGFVAECTMPGADGLTPVVKQIVPLRTV